MEKISPKWLLWGFGGAAALSVAWVIQTKIGHFGTLGGIPRYALPHHALSLAPTEREIWLQTTDGIGIDGTYLASNRPFGLILYPSWVSGRKGFAIVSLARWLAPAYQVVILDPRGVGGSKGKQGPDGEGKLDILAAAAFLREQGATRIGVLAEGDGAIAAVRAASEQRGIDAVLLSGPSGAWGEAVPGEGWWMHPRSAMGRFYWWVATGTRLGTGRVVQLADMAPHVSPIPLVVMASKDAPGHMAQQFYMAAAEPRGLRLLPGSGLPVDWNSYAAFHEATRDWFRMSLTPQATAEAALPASVPAPIAAPPSAGQDAEMRQLMADPQPLVPTLPTAPRR